MSARSLPPTFHGFQPTNPVCFWPDLDCAFGEQVRVMVACRPFRAAVQVPPEVGRLSHTRHLALFLHTAHGT